MPRDPRQGRSPRDRAVNPFGDGNARSVAYDLITSALKGSGPFENIRLEHEGLRRLSARDRALAVHMAAGVLRRLRTLDARAALLTNGKFSGLPEPVRWILRLGLFQVFGCDRVPPHAAVSTAVEAAKSVSHRGIAGLVNAVLRRAVREKENPPARVESVTGQMSLGERLSMPDWLAEQLLARFGSDTVGRIERWANSPPVFYYRLAQNGSGLERLNELLHNTNLAPGKPHDEFPEYVAVETAALVAESPLFTEPLGWVHNPAGGLVVALLDPQPGDIVLDLFAAPGGKALAISEAVGSRGRVLAVDISVRRLQRLADNKSRLQAENILPIRADVAELGERHATRILADVPCSALGTLPKNPEVRWLRTPADIDRLARSQRIWLNVAATHLDAGGVLVYATCTLTREENESVIEAFLQANPDFVLEPAEDFVPEKYVTEDGCLATTPPFDGLDGVFAARLRRRGGNR